MQKTHPGLCAITLMTEIRRLAKIPESTIKCVIKKIFDQCVVNLQISVKNQPAAVRPHPLPGWPQHPPRPQRGSRTLRGQPDRPQPWTPGLPPSPMNSPSRYPFITKRHRKKRGITTPDHPHSPSANHQGWMQESDWTWPGLGSVQVCAAQGIGIQGAEVSSFRHDHQGQQVLRQVIPVQGALGGQR